MRYTIVKLWYKEEISIKTRPLEIDEYKSILELMINGFICKVDGKEKEFRPNLRIALALQLQASLGLRIGDVLKLMLNNFKNGRLEIIEEKTRKLQYREINSSVINAVYQYALENNIKQNELLFDIGVRAVQKQLKIVTEHLGLNNISTHSFRKLYAVTIYEQNNNNIELLKELLNHTSVETTQKYIRVSQQSINEASQEINFMI